MTLPILTVFARSPDQGRGLARDMRIRWALEEVGRPYEVRAIDFEAMRGPAHRARNPFGQIPTWEEGDLVLFESGAIVLHIATTSPGLLPAGEPARTRAIAWMFAALDTVEPPIVEASAAAREERDRPWWPERQPILAARVSRRLEELSDRLEGREWLENGFTAADILMITVLQRAAAGGRLEPHPVLRAYVARGEARDAYRRAFADQLALFRRNATGAPAP